MTRINSSKLILESLERALQKRACNNTKPTLRATQNEVLPLGTNYWVEIKNARNSIERRRVAIKIILSDMFNFNLISSPAFADVLDHVEQVVSKSHELSDAVDKLIETRQKNIP
ncbi:hypothetical protein [Woodsholea maritima]|uniref:hypothetical protein n=1 Tax=Woodsholea maritima TaxID=240237 RepID=UPI0012EA70FA|nr:hypothetical protein [Woodsholea maritima]